MTRRTQRVHDVSAYLLHASAWRETSLIVQTMSRSHGIVSLVAKGAKRPQSALRPVLSAFQPLLLSWSSRGEIGTLTRAECMGVLPLAGSGLMSAWYMNELLLRLLPREDAHPALFDAYDAALRQLARVPPNDAQAVSACLRRFEWVLLQETGYGLDIPMPDFDDPKQLSRTRQHLRDRLDEQLGRPLLTRKVLLELHRP